MSPWRRASDGRRRRDIHRALQTLRGSDHPDYLYAKEALAIIYFRIGDWAQCETIFRDLLRKAQQVLGDENPFTIGIIKGLSTVLRKQEKTPEALNLVIEASGKSHKLASELRAGIVRLECILGHADEAIRLMSEELATRKKGDDVRIARWLSDPDFEPIHNYLRTLE
jgi:hypothetical protein